MMRTIKNVEKCALSYGKKFSGNGGGGCGIMHGSTSIHNLSAHKYTH
jgi:mevalonate kinase